MPIIEDQRVLPAIGRLPEIEEVEGPGIGEVVAAAFRQENSLVSSVVRLNQDIEEDSFIDETFDPFEDIEGYEENANDFAFANTPSQASSIKRQIDQERKDRATIQEGGALGVASLLAAGGLDPVNFIPIGGAAYKSYRIGDNVLTSAMASAKAGLLTSTAAEAVLQHNQFTRTWGEGVVNVAAGTFLSGLLGGAVGTVKAVRLAKLARSEADTTAAMEKDFDVPAPEQPDPITPNEIEIDGGSLARDTGSVGAAAVRGTTEAEETLKSALGLEKGIAFRSKTGRAFSDPMLRLSTSESIESRRMIQRLAETPLLYKKNEIGIETPIAAESMIGQHQNKLYVTSRGLDEQFVKYRRGRSKQFGDVARVGVADVAGQAKREGVLTYKQFKEAVGEAMFSGDKHEIPQVAEAAKIYRRELFDPLKDDAIELGLLPEDVDVKTADSYFMRIYNQEKITARRPEFKRKLTDWLRREQVKSGERAEQFPAEAEKFRTDIRETRREIQAIEKAVTKATVKEITEAATTAAKKALDDIDLELPAPAPKPGREQIESKALKAARAKQLKTLQKEIQEAIKEESELALEAAAEDALAAISRTLDEEDIADISALLREEIPAPVAKAGEEAAIEAVTKFEKLFKSTALEEANKTFNRSVKAQLKRLEKAADLDDEALTAQARAKLLREVKREITNEAKKAANAAAREATKTIRESLGDLVKTFKARKKLQQKDVFKTKFELEELDDQAEQIIDRIQGLPGGRLPYDLTIERSRPGAAASKAATAAPLKQRSLLIEDAEIKEFLELDVEGVARVYTRSLAPDIELKREFETLDPDILRAQIRDDWAKKLTPEMSEKDLQKWQELRDGDIEDFIGVWDRMRGTYGIPQNPNGMAVRAARTVRTLNYLRLLGGMTASAFPDTARPVMVHGISRVYGDGLRPMVKNFRKFRLATEEVKLSGTALDMVLDTRALAIADVMDDYGRYSTLERGVKGLQDRFGVVTLMAPWNAAMKQFSGVVTMSRMLQAMKKIAKDQDVDPKEIEKLASQGINPDMARKIWGEFENFGEESDGIFMPNTGDWEFPDTANIFRAALKKEVDKIIVTPGQDKPLWMSTELGKTIGQFKSFQMASVQRTMLSGLQQRDLAALNGASLSVGLGMMSYAFKQWDAGRELSDDPKVWIVEGVDRSGLTGWFFEANNMMEKASRGRVGVNALLGGPPMSRYASRNMAGALLGPSFDVLGDVPQVTGAVATGDWQKNDTRALRRLLPYQNLLGFRQLLDKAESGINDAIGARK